MTSEAILKAFEEDTNRKKILIRRAEVAKGRLTFITEAMKQLFSNYEFKRLLEEEGLISIPEALGRRLST